MKNTIIYLNHILNRCIKIERITSSVSESEFMSDEDAQDIVIRSLEIIGEATTHLSDEFKSKYSEIPWRKIKNFRNIIIHQYFKVDLQSVWGTAIEDIPVLHKQIESIIDLENKQI